VNVRPLFLLLLLLTPITISPVLADEISRPAQVGEDGYLNRYKPVNRLKGGFLLWQLQQWWYEVPEGSKIPPKNIPPDLDFIHNPQGQTAITWIGHSTVLIQLDGVNILTDPVFSNYVTPLPPFGPRRYQPPGLSLAQLPHIDVVLLSHNHYDHLDLPSIRALAHQSNGPPIFLVPLGNKQWFRDNFPELHYVGPLQTVFELDWDEHYTVHGNTNDLTINFDAVQHWAERGIFDRNRTLWGSWAIIHPKLRFWFSGDLGYSPDTRDIGRKYGYFDYAAIAIGAYAPHWYMKTYHINPAEAVQVMLDVNAKRAFGVHWGTFPLSDERVNQPPEDLKQALSDKELPENRFTVLHIGETKKIEKTKKISTVEP
jgi:L-ascorbate metabolism protein UlaG (beta-lactamase superfamily)